jgi:hypothetical protein
MAVAWRQALVFGEGLLLGGGLVAATILWGKDLPSAAPAAAAQQHLISAAGGATACQEAPLLASAGERDGQFGTQIDITDKTVTDVTAYLAVGGDTASQGRPRDAELALLTACRIAAGVAGPASVELAEASYQLARHYTAAAAAGAPDDQRAALLQRAEALFSHSRDLYAARFGQPHEKTRLAAAGLTLAKQAGALSAPMQVAAAQVAAAASAPASAASAPKASASATAVAANTPSTVKRKPKPKPEEETEMARTRDEPPSQAREMGAGPAAVSPPNPFGGDALPAETSPP